MTASHEQTSLLSSNHSKAENTGAIATPAPPRRCIERLTSSSRFGQFETDGVRPSLDKCTSVPGSLAKVQRGGRRVVSFRKNIDLNGGGGGVKKSGRARSSRHSTIGLGVQSYMRTMNGAVSALTPLEMGRRELYQALPFISLPGLQKKEHDISVAYSSYAAALDNEETDQYLQSTTGKGLDPNEKERRLTDHSLIMLEELEVEAASVTMPLVFTVFIASLMAFNFGYNISVMNPGEVVAFPGHTTSMWSIAVSALCIGGPLGAILAGRWADQMGRRGALLFTSWLFVGGGLVQTASPSLAVVVVARTILGVASGAVTVLVPIYLGELAPPNLRGVIGTMTQFAFVLGLFAADLLGLVLANERLWRCMPLPIVIIGMCPLLLKPYLFESPRWLLQRNPDSEEARHVIKKLRGFRYDEDVETEVEHYVDASKSQSLESEGGEQPAEEEGPKRSATAELFADKKVRLLLVSSLVLQVSSQFSGINAVFYYSTLFFDGVIDDPLTGTILTTAVNVLATYLALFVVDRFGRRTLLMVSSGGMFFSCILITLALLGYFENMVALMAVILYVMFYELGLGPIPMFIVAEMFDGKYVATAMSVSLQLNWVCNFFVGLLFPHIDKTFGPYSFIPFATSLFFTFLYAWIYLPETQGTTPAKLQAELIRKNAGVTYHNMDIEGMYSSFPRAPLNASG